MKTNFYNSGQSLIGIIIVLVIVGLISGGLYYYLSKQIPEVPEIAEKPAEEEIVKPEEITSPPEEEIAPEEVPPEEITPPEEVVTPPCQNECSPSGSKRCLNNGYQICGNYDADNCLEWSPTTICPQNTICQNGACIQQKCSDGTLYGQCSINKPKYCENGNLIDKASLCGCSSGYEISDNQCVIKIACQNECTSIGSKKCSNNGYQICGNYDNDTCLEWGPAISCSAGTSCVMGNCITTEVEYWAITFGTAEDIDAYNYLPLVLKDILILHGWKEDHIKYFTGKGVTYANVMNALDWLANNTDPNDIVLFHSMTHGSSDGIYLNDKFLEFNKLAEKLDEIKYSGLTIIIDACYSGGAIPVLKKENRIIMTAARSNEMGIAPGFSQRILAALQGFGDIEGNNNDWVSAEEAFNFAQTRYSGPQVQPWPQIQDDYLGEFKILFLDGYWRYLDQFNIEKGKNSFTGLNYLGDNPLEDEVRIYAQSFKPNYPILTKAMLGVYFGSGKPGPLTVSVRKDLSGSDLTSATLNQNIIRPFSSQFYEFDFPDIEVIPNETYYLVIKVSYAVGKDDYYNLWVDNVGSYPEGSYPRGTTFFKGISPPIPWTDISPADLYFATFGKPK